MEIDRVKLFKDLMVDEGLRLKPYRCSAGKLTIGFGHNLEARGISESVAAAILHEDIDYDLPGLYQRIPWLRDYPEPVQRALANMAFNMGTSKLMRFVKMLKALRDRNYSLAAEEALDSKWARQVGDRAIRIAELLEGPHGS
ncbi:hypothetical protein LCGC14_0389580 [marine sediment metagenome]|uniref:Lysozyme n=1 Tax=marine sediment metagenome TaxID=412755 RepID=A0A0F9VM21_9ZZZZ